MLTIADVALIFNGNKLTAHRQSIHVLMKQTQKMAQTNPSGRL
jgi:hypothetical protein